MYCITHRKIRFYHIYMTLIMEILGKNILKIAYDLLQSWLWIFLTLVDMDEKNNWTQTIKNLSKII